MANKIWRGDAPIVQEVYTLVPGGTIEADDKFLVTINGKTINTTGGSATAATVAATVQTALAASEIDEFEEVTWTVSSATITGTGPDDGTPVTISGSTTEANGGAADAQTFTITNTVDAQGPHDWNVAGNWSASGVPSSDVVYILESDTDIKYGLDQSAVDITSLTVYQSFTGDIGLPLESADGEYFEYRTTYLTHQTCTTYNIGEGDGSGSGRLKLSAGAAASTLNVWNTGSRKDPGIPSLLWKGTHATNVANIHRGDVGIAFLPGETAVIATLRIGYVDNPIGDARVVCGSGTTLTTVVMNGGTLTTSSAITTITIDQGQWESRGGAVTTINARNCTVIWNSTGTITNLNLDSDSIFDAEQDERAFTVTNCTLKKGATLKNRKRRITFTNGIILDGCAIDDVTLDLGDDITVTVTYN